MSQAPPNKVLHIGLWVAQGLMAFAFFMSGGMKVVTPQPELVEMGMMFAGRFPSPAAMIIGGLEVLGAIGLILPAALRVIPILTPIAAACLVLTMAVAGLDHLVAGELDGLAPTIVLGGICAFISFGRFKLAPIEPR